MNVVKIMDVSAMPSLKDSGTKQVDGDFLQQFDQAVKEIAKDAIMSHVAENTNAQPQESQETEQAEMPKMDQTEDAQQKDDSDITMETADPQSAVVIPAVVIVPDTAEVMPQQIVEVEPALVQAVTETTAVPEITQNMELPAEAPVVQDAAPTEETPFNAMIAAQDEPNVAQTKQPAVAVEIEAPVKDQQVETAVQGNIMDNVVPEKEAAVAGTTISVDEPETAQIVQQTLKEADQILKQQQADHMAGTEGLQVTEEKQTTMPVETADDAEKPNKDSQNESFTKPMTANVAENGKVEFIKTPAPVTEAELVQQKQEVLNQIVEKVTTSVSEEKSEFYLQLKPDHLGGLSILLASDEKGLMAKLVTASKEVQSMIQNDMVAMQEALKAKGVNVVHMEVVYDQMASATGKDHSSEGQGSTRQMNTGVHGGTQDIMIDGATMFYDEMTMYEVLTEQGGSVEFNA